MVSSIYCRIRSRDLQVKSLRDTFSCMYHQFCFQFHNKRTSEKNVNCKVVFQLQTSKKPINYFFEIFIQLNYVFISPLVFIIIIIGGKINILKL